tara:strand:+ start:3963 stop:4127 length:165 start_codon:yes stop_codon:yes gene_type:complete
MRFEVIITINVDPDANFLEVDDRYNLSVIQEMIEDCIYDIDDVTIENCEVKKDD